MPKFSYKGVNAQGKIVGGELEGIDRDDITRQVKGFGYFPTQIKQLTGEIHPDELVIREMSVWERLRKWIFGSR